MSAIEADLEQGRRFLKLLDPDVDTHCFQTFDDSPLKRRSLARTLIGGHAKPLIDLQAEGAGVFFAVNAIKGRRRLADKVTRVRAVFCDLDGAPVQPVMACVLDPHAIIKSSPGRYHAYWMVDDLPRDQFRGVQRAIAKRFGGDPSVIDLCRVMRLPGFYHLKGEPFQTRLHQVEQRLPYTSEQILAEFPPEAAVRANGMGNGHDGQAEEMAELVRQLLNAETFHAALRSLAWRYMGAGMAPGQTVETLRGFMLTIPEAERDDRWRARFEEIPRTVTTAEAKILAQGGAIGPETDPGEEPDLLPGDALFDLSHDGLALHMGKGWVRWARHVNPWGRWLFWSGSQWIVDEKRQHLTRTRDYLRSRADAIVRAAKDGKFLPEMPDRDKAIQIAEAQAKTLRMAPSIASVVDLARSNADLAASIEQWDADIMLLGGERTINLRDGSARYPDPLDYIVKHVACAPSSDPPSLWLSCLETWTAGDKELQNYLQRMCGYMLTGSIEEEVFFFFYGLGKNGKTKFAETIKGILKDYAGTMGSEVLMASHNERHPTEIARLRGLRLAVASEIEHGKAWAESKVKQMTGGDKLQARFMRQDIFEFTPQFKLLVIGNNKPSLSNVDEAIKRRLHLVPFTVTIPENKRDPKLAKKLQDEWPQILGWMIQGCKDWQRIGLRPPKAVLAATADYLAGEDAFEQWRDANATLDINAFELAAELWASWSAWAQRANEPAGSQKRFSQLMEERGFSRHREGTGQRGFRGLRLTRIDPTAGRADLQ